MHPHDYQAQASLPALRGDPDRLLDTDAVAELLHITPVYARQLRVHGGGPRFIKLTAKAVRYRAGDVLAWIDSRPSATSTSELKAP